MEGHWRRRGRYSGCMADVLAIVLFGALVFGVLALVHLVREAVK